MSVEIPDDLRQHIDVGDSAAFATELMVLDPRDRAALMTAFRQLVRAGGLWKETGPLLVAGAAILPTPAQVAAWFHRPQLRWFHGPYEPIMAVLARHDAAWLGELGTRLAKDLRPDGVGHYHIAATLIGISGAPVPTSDNFVRRWAFHRFRATEPSSWAELRSDPFLPALLPRIFDVDGLGPVLQTGAWEERGDSSPSAGAMARLVALADEGIVARSVLLEGTLGRLLRGDTPAALRPFVELHRQLRPTLDELAAHVADYLRLLPDARAFVASTAQGALRTLDESGRLSPDALAEASGAVFSRPEKGMFREQLSWLKAVAGRDPARTAEVVALLTRATTHPDLGLADQARSLVEQYGGGVVAMAAQEPVVVPSVANQAPDVQPPIGSLAELAADAAIVVDGEPTAMDWERVLDGIARMWTQTSPADMVRVLAPFADRYARAENLYMWYPRHIITRLAGISSAPAEPFDMEPGIGSAAIMQARVSELATLLPSTPVPFLLAVPTSPTGHLSASTLVARIEELERLGVDAWPYDLEQALLRLPREVDPDALSRAKRLTSPTAATLADWLARGGLGDPITTRVVVPHWWWTAPRTAVVVEIEDRPTAGPLTRTVLGRRVGPGHSDYAPDPQTWPAAMPSHREVVAAHMLRGIAESAELGLTHGCPPLTFLTDCTGPAGPAVALTLAYGMSAKKAQVRTSAADAILAVGPDVDLLPTGREVGTLAVLRNIKLNRVCGVLADVAAAGASPRVWTILTAALPVLLDEATPPPGMADVLQLAAKIAAQLGSRAEVPGLSELATRGGSGQLVTEARRLQRVFDGGQL